MTAPATDAVVLQGVRLDRGGRTILRDLDLRVPAGSITAVLGPSGTGKSTLLAAITGELVPAAGQVRVFDQPVPRGARALLEMRKRIGVLLQGNGLLTDLSVAENVALPLRAHTTLPEPLLQRLVAMKLNAVGLRAAERICFTTMVFFAVMLRPPPSQLRASSGSRRPSCRGGPRRNGARLPT